MCVCVRADWTQIRGGVGGRSLIEQQPECDFCPSLLLSLFAQPFLSVFCHFFHPPSPCAVLVVSMCPCLIFHPSIHPSIQLLPRLKHNAARKTIGDLDKADIIAITESNCISRNRHQQLLFFLLVLNFSLRGDVKTKFMGYCQVKSRVTPSNKISSYCTQ